MTNKHYLIRGKRILQQLEERTAGELERNTMNFVPPASPSARQHIVNSVQVQKVEFAPNRQDGILTVRVIVNSNGHKYEPSLQFDKVIYDDGDQSDNTTFKGTDNREYHIVPIELAKHNAKVRCNCLDFYYRFAPQNNTDQSLLGNPPPPYQKKTVRPAVNPQKVPGVCKHLLRAIQALRSVNVVR